jgi:hypothetical protein
MTTKNNEYWIEPPSQTPLIPEGMNINLNPGDLITYTQAEGGLSYCILKRELHESKGWIRERYIGRNLDDLRDELHYVLNPAPSQLETVNGRKP